MMKNEHKSSDNHNDNRGKICTVCLAVDNRKKKIRFRKVIPSGEIEKRINTLFEYNAADTYLPNAICNICYLKLYKGSTIAVPNFRKLVRTRSTAKLRCECKVCQIVRHPKSFGGSSVKLGNLSKSKSKSQETASNSNFGDILKSIKQLSHKETDQLIAILLKKKAESISEKRGRAGKVRTMTLTQRAGRPLTVTIGSTTNKNNVPRMISAKDMLTMKTTFNFSQNKTVGIARFFRKATRKRKLIEPNLKQYLKAAIHSVDEFFEVKEFEFSNTKAGKTSTVKKEVIFCKNLSGFLEYVKNKREVSHSHLKFGIDGGGGSLKICLSLQSIYEDSIPNKSRRKYEDDVPTKDFRDSGVKKLFILALAVNTQENHDNVLKLWSALKINEFINEFDGKIAVDLKLANILCGIMSHSSLYPCTWCYSKKDELSECSQLRTLQNILDNFTNWRDAGSVKNQAKNFFNCIHPPILGNDKDKRIIDIITPPELHLMLGVVNTLYNHMLAEFEEATLIWTKRCNVTREETRAGAGFNGNSCKMLLDKIDVLRAVCPIGCLKYVTALDDFRLVVKSCFGENLNPNFIKHIQDFQKSYVDLKISITPKVHAVFYHVKDFCHEHQKALGYFSEQAMESVHFNFKTVWSKYEVKPNHSEFPTHLLKAVCEFNGLHL